MKPVVFTDLDGTLLHPEDYSFDAALPAVEYIKRHNIPLVFCSSKTRREIEVIRRRLSNNHPFVSENGGGVFIPEGYFPFPTGDRRMDGYSVVVLGKPYGEVRRAFVDIRNKTGLRLVGFGDMGVDEVSEVTGLSTEEAELAKMRDFEEPFIFQGDEEGLKILVEEIQKRGLSFTKGRLFHILGPHDKGRAIRLLKGFYKELYGEIVSIGAGDGLNDEPMLREVDYPVLVRKGDGGYESLDVPGLLKADGVGPEGWRSAIMDILKKEALCKKGPSP